jgi:hypothetical protein
VAIGVRKVNVIVVLDAAGRISEKRLKQAVERRTTNSIQNAPIDQGCRSIKDIRVLPD